MSEEEYITLEYKIDLRESEITKQEVIPYIRQTIEEAKKRYPEKAADLEEIEIVDTRDHLLEFKFHPEAVTIVEIIIALTLRRIIVDTWRKVVIPLIQKKLKIEEYRDNNKEKKA